MNLSELLPPGLGETLAILASRWDSAGPLLGGFPLLAKGRPVSTDAIASAAGVEVTQVEQAVDAARCKRDPGGRLIDLYGLTLQPTRHRLEIGQKILFSGCALWAYVVPRLVDATARVESVDPVRQERVRLSVAPTGIESVDPPNAAATLVVASQEAIDRDVCTAFCGKASFFVSLESAEEFAADHPTCRPVELPEFQQAARLFHRAIWRAIET